MSLKVWRELWRANQEDGYGTNLLGRISFGLLFTALYCSFDLSTNGSIWLGLVCSLVFPWLPFSLGLLDEYQGAKRRVNDPEYAKRWQKRIDDALGRRS